MYNEKWIIRGWMLYHHGFNNELYQFMPALFRAFERHGKRGLQAECAAIQRSTYIPVYALVSDAGAWIAGDAEIIQFRLI